MHAAHCCDASAGPVQADAAAADVFTAAAESAAQRWKYNTGYKAKVSVVTGFTKDQTMCVLEHAWSCVRTWFAHHAKAAMSVLQSFLQWQELRLQWHEM